MEEALEDRVARLAAQHESGNGEALALTQEAMTRLAYRRRHSGKECSYCGEGKPLSAFGPDSSRPDGLGHRCRDCDNWRKREARARRV